MRVKEDTTDDYLVAGRGMHPALAALSAVSTWNSGYMFIGFIGFTYSVGYSAIWIGLASTVGQVLAWVWLYKYIQQEAHFRGVRSLSSLVANVAGAPEAKLASCIQYLERKHISTSRYSTQVQALNSRVTPWSRE